MSMKRIIGSAFLGALVATSAIGCGGSDDDESTEGGSEAGSEVIGADGGSVMGGGAEVSIPAGALADDVEVGLAEVSVDGASAPDGYELAGPTIAFTPHGTSFDEAVTIMLPFESDSSDLVVLRLEDEDDTTWEVVQGGDFDDGMATLEVESFSIYGVAEALGGGSDMAIDQEAACTEVCEWKISLGCASEMNQADCEADCNMDPVPEPGDMCFEEYVAFGNCLDGEAADAYECKEDGTAGLIDGVCADELTELFNCSMGGN